MCFLTELIVRYGSYYCHEDVILQDKYMNKKLNSINSLVKSNFFKRKLYVSLK